MLESSRFHMAIAFGYPLFRSRGVTYAAGAIERGAVVYHGSINDYRLVDIDVANNGGIHPGDRGVVVKDSTPPLAAYVAEAEIAEAVIDAAVEAHVRPPVSRMPQVNSARETPVSRSPQRARVGWGSPGARYPVITIRTIGPIAGTPDITGLRAGRLDVHRYDRRGDADADRDAGKRSGRYEADKNPKK